MRLMFSHLLSMQHREGGRVYIVPPDRRVEFVRSHFLVNESIEGSLLKNEKHFLPKPPRTSLPLFFSNSLHAQAELKRLIMVVCLCVYVITRSRCNFFFLSPHYTLTGPHSNTSFGILGCCFTFDYIVKGSSEECLLCNIYWLSNM